MSSNTLLYVVGARPNFMKVAPILQAMRAVSTARQVLVHTGQHYDDEMSAVFFRELGLPEPDITLGVGSDSHARQTARIMAAIEPVLEREQPTLVVVVGDVNSTLAAALVAAKLGLPLAHIEAGLRSFDRRMPEEINRLVTDALADLLFATEPSAVHNLRREGIAEDRIFLVGNVMVDTLLRLQPTAAELDMHTKLGLERASYAVVTVHRPENVDSPDGLLRVLHALEEVQTLLPVVYPLHPRARLRFQEADLEPKLHALPGLILTQPLGYLEFISLMSAARFVLTDSGGIQEETTALGIPCLTLRENTERPITVEEGTNSLVGTDAKRLRGEVDRILEGRWKQGQRPELWDGRAAQRIARVLGGILARGVT